MRIRRVKIIKETYTLDLERKVNESLDADLLDVSVTQDQYGYTAVLKFGE